MSNACERRRENPIGTRDMRDQYGLVKLSSPCQHGRDKSNAKASALVAKKVCHARCFVVLIFRQVGICELASGNKKKRDAKTLHYASPGFMAVISGEIEAGEVPHGATQNCKTEANHPRDRNVSYHPSDQWRHDDDHKR